MNEKRLVVALFGLAVAVVIGALAYRFIAAFTVSVFLYYSTRRYHRFLARFRLPPRVRAGVVLASLAIPLILLISYAGVLLVVEARQFVADTALVSAAASNIAWFAAIERIPEFTVQGIYGAYRSGDLEPFVEFATENAAFLTTVVSEFLLNLFVVTIVTYYLLVDGDRISDWLLRFDDDAIVREYLEAVDRELEAVLFGNLLNVVAISLIAIATFSVYNALVPAGVRVPYPALAGALTGIASLVPIVGMKIVYLPVTAAMAVPPLLGGSLAELGYVLGFLVVAVVVVDTVPDLVLRPLLSGDETHVGLLMLAYTLGPVVLGFYGLFFAPIVLVIGLTFANTALPRLLGADDAQTTLSASDDAEGDRERDDDSGPRVDEGAGADVDEGAGVDPDPTR
ncbi:AI-2E family transporter [Halobaculum rarum]|uniref:AI-2E family transporter n=1 Tax=Halobaculum rarum TaxID=3075122 RepID=UPI0032AFFAB4